jgi:hypothetical protein
MSPQFQVELGPFSFSIRTDASGVTVQRGPGQEMFLWNSIEGALLVRSKAEDAETEERNMAEAAAFLGGAIDPERAKELQRQMATVHIAYRDEHNRLRQKQIPIPLSEPVFLQEFQSQLGKRWLGEAADESAAERKLHTAPNLFKGILVLFLILAGVVLLGAFGLYSLLAPALNFLSLRQMYFDLQAGDWASFALHGFTYVALFAMAIVLRRLWRNYRDAKRTRSHPSRFR